MKSLYSLIVALFIASFTLHSQPTNNLIGDVSMAAPTPANLLKFSDIPVAYQTGVPSISIPLYTVQEGNLSLPISLKYHASGVQPATNASWVGDWTLMAGGTITRTVMNIRDEDSEGYYNIGGILTENSIANGDTASFMANGLLDSEPDIFAFNFAGYSGKFLFDVDSKATGEVRFVTQNNLKLEWNILGNQWEYFTMITPDGTRYFFGKIPGTNITAYETSATTTTVDQRSSWHLLRIQSYDGNYKIDFSYEDDWSAYKSPASCKFIYSECEVSGQQGFNSFDNFQFQSQSVCSSDFNDGIYHPWLKMTNKGKRLCSITTPNCMVSFVADTTREDVELHPDAINPSKRLDRIEVTSGAYQFDCLFSYDYWYDDSSIPGYTWSAMTQQNQAEFKRLRLNAVQKVAADNSVSEAPFLFTYETRTGEPDYFPFRLTKAIDHWGYFNSAEGNNARNLNIPQTIVYGNESTLSYDDMIDRESDETAMKYGVLKQIQYPTGGIVDFDFEANTVPAVENGTPTSQVTVTSCNDPTNPNCCNMASDTADYTFTSIEEVKNTVFELCISATQSPSGGSMTTNCTDAGTDDIITVRVDILEPITGMTGSYRKIGGWGFGIEESLAQSSFCPIVADGAPISEILYPGEALDTSIQYRFAVITDNAFGVYEMRSLGDIEYTDRAVGGLRIKQITRSDGIASTDNDIIKTYNYTTENDTMRSSGVLVREPSYGHYLQVASNVQNGSFNQSLSGTAVFFNAESIVPLSSFEGYHVRYHTVTEDHNGNGESIYRNQIEALEIPLASIYPIPPESVRIRDGKTEEKYHYREDGTLESTENIVPDFAYTDIPGFAGKVLKTELECTDGVTGQTLDFIAYTPYTNRVGYYLNGTVTTTLDGVETITEYEYDHANGLRHLFPTATTFTNSDEVEYKTINEYVFDFNDAVYDEMVDSNIIANPVRTTLEITDGASSYQISGVETECSFFDSNGMPVASQTGNADPYPHKLHQFKRSFDENGNLTTGFWELEATIEERYADSETGKAGYRKIIKTEDWNLRDTLDWYHGILQSRAFGEHQTIRTFHPNTRLIASSTDIDGQPIFINYDQLMRVDTVLVRPKNSSPNPRNTNDFNVVTTADYVYPQMVNDLAYKRIRTDYTTESTGNSAYEFTESTTYVDGLGRLIQTIQTQHSPENELDVVVSQQWDNQGRIERVYEPFESSFNNGDYVSTIPNNQPFTRTRYLNSPLNRVRGTTPPAWFESLSEYSSNAANEVQNLETGMPYPANSLNKQIITDPDDKRTISFSDKKGRLVMTRHDSIGSSSFTETYRLYDTKDRPTKIIPPDATLTDMELIYIYLYNEDDKLIEKKIPGAAVVTMQYDDREILTAMQNGILRGDDRWLVTQLDDYGRAIKTGFYLNASIAPDPNAPIINDGILTETFYDGVLPSAPDLTDDIYIGRVSYQRTNILDERDTSSNFIETQFTYDEFGRNTSTTGNNHINSMMGSEQMTMQYDFADNMVISDHSQSAFGTTTMVQERMSYDHKARQINAFHTINSQAEEHCSNLAYTVRDLIKTRNLAGLGMDDYLQEVNYSYNAQRWLNKINDPLQIGGGSGGNEDGSEAAANDLFYLRINYNIADDTLSARSQKSGNISKLTWQAATDTKLNLYGFDYDFLDRVTRSTYATEDGNGKAITNDFSTGYAYDDRGNITQLMRKGRNDGIVQTIDSLNYSYFANSNQIQQIGDDAACPDRIVQDQDIEQSVDYRASQCITFKEGFSFKADEDGTMTAKIECVSGIKFTRGFQDRDNGQDYAYDASGNLSFDPDRKMDILYNHLNLPYQVIWDDEGVTRTIEWLYTADGTKLRKTVSKDGTTTSKKDYLSKLEYQSDTLEAIYHGDGRAIATGSGALEYQYNIKDHLGNTRIVFKNNGSGIPTIISKSAYYPFGFEIEELRSQTTPRYDYLYNGKELDSEFSLNYYHYGARIFDPLSARFVSIDPIADQFAWASPYNYAENDPIVNIDLHGLQKYGMHLGVQAGREHYKNDEQKLQEYNEAVKNNEQRARTAGVVMISLMSPVDEFAVLGFAAKKIPGAARAYKAVKGFFKSGDETKTLYRGVNEASPAYDDALEGAAKPRGGNNGHTDPMKHNAGVDGTADSAMTSWTTDKDVALNYAFRPTKNEGALLTKEFPVKELIESPDTKNILVVHTGRTAKESEVLVKGNVTGAKTEKVRFDDYNTKGNK